MTDEHDLDLEALDQLFKAGEATLLQSSGAGAAFHGGLTALELTEALPSSPGRPSESYEAPFPNWALEGANARKVPGSGLACVTCPEAVWMSGGEDLQAFCRVLRATTWSTLEAVPMQIAICTGKEMAIVAMLEAQTSGETGEQLRAGR